MRVPSWLRPLAARLGYHPARRKSARHRPAARLRLVALEDRAVPTASHFSEYAVPTPASGPDYMTLGSDGNVWFSEYGAVNATGGGKIGRITPDGQITEFDTTYPYVGAIVAGPDGNLWFTENNDLTTFGGPPAPFLGIYERVAREEAVLLWGW